MTQGFTGSILFLFDPQGRHAFPEKLTGLARGSRPVSQSKHVARARIEPNSLLKFGRIIRMAKPTANTAGNAPVSEKDNPNTSALTKDEYKDETEIAGPLAAVLSLDRQEELSFELRELMMQIQDGFGDLTKPSDIYKMDQPFYVVNAVTIPDYLDKNTGEEKMKHIFRLEFSDGIIRSVMQGAARPRTMLATAFEKARRLGVELRVGPYKFTEKQTKQPQPALIFTQQPGFKQAVSR